MALPAFAPVDSIEDWLGESVEPVRAQALLDAASTLVRTETGSAWVDALGALMWLADDASEKLQIIGQAFAHAVVSAAARAYTNPNGFIQEGTGPFSGTRHRDSGDGVFLTATEKRAITEAVAGYKGKTHSGLWSLSTTRGDCYDDTIYVPTAPEPSGYPLPFLHPDDDI